MRASSKDSPSLRRKSPEQIRSAHTSTPTQTTDQTDGGRDKSSSEKPKGQTQKKCGSWETAMAMQAAEKRVKREDTGYPHGRGRRPRTFVSQKGAPGLHWGSR